MQNAQSNYFHNKNWLIYKIFAEQINSLVFIFGETLFVNT